jgi:hypothetical protein
MFSKVVFDCTDTFDFEDGSENETKVEARADWDYYSVDDGMPHNDAQPVKSYVVIRSKRYEVNNDGVVSVLE